MSTKKKKDDNEEFFNQYDQKSMLEFQALDLIKKYMYEFEPVDQPLVKQLLIAFGEKYGQEILSKRKD